MAGQLRTLLGLLGLLVAASTTLATCPNTNWLLIDSKCYLPLSIPPFSQATADNALAMCRHIHPTAKLPEIFDSDDQLTIQELTQGYETWLGLRRATSSSYWTWPSTSSVNYTHWMAGEPADDFSCASMRKDGGWKAASCNVTSASNHVVCYVASEY